MRSMIPSKIKNNKYILLLIKSNICLALIINLFFLFAVLIFCDIKYEVSDDFIMASIISGAYGNVQNPQMIFVNMILGYLMIPFYKIFPEISWYFVFQLGLIFVSSTTVTYFLLEQTERFKALMLSVIFILFCVNDAYVLVQFTKTAIFAVMAGSVLFIRELFYGKNKIRIIFGTLLCLTGTMVRFDVINIAGVFLIFIIIYELLFMIKQKLNKAVLLKRILQISLYGTILICLAFGFRKIDRYTYNNDEPYSFFSAYSAARSQIVDFNGPDYTACANEFEKIGISENDYNMMKSWNFADNEVFSLEKMQQVGKIVRAYYKELERKPELLFERLQIRNITAYPIFLGCVILILIGMFLNTKKWWTMLISVGIGIGLLFYFSYRDRCIYRIEYSVLMAVFICVLYFWSGKKKEQLEVYKDNKRVYSVCIIISVLCLLWNISFYIPDYTYKTVTNTNRKDYIEEVFYNSWDFDARKYRRVVNKERVENGLLKEIEQNPENFYFLDFRTTIQTLYYEYSPWKALTPGYYSNFLYLGGVTTNFPDVVNILQSRNKSNALASLVDEGVYLVDNQTWEMKLNFLHEHYYPNASVELYKEVDGYLIWKFYEN